ncbi:probable L-type lectin-domain containing receptor kinase S.7 [Phalaenopsis equestris]|uniref:probable L-type lectin-domain containing receptor kinase S.7 n=1 Tax=Phalaenopsis equestris TaxID=78828 RepID=UPI0009E1A338|nr:probable L-type lectin-domain containing receptor kinase S.7 [Phalaenopsis equestris]
MDQERTHCIHFLVLLFLLLPSPPSSLHCKYSSASTPKLIFDSPPRSSVKNATSQLSSCTSVIFSLPAPKANSAEMNSRRSIYPSVCPLRRRNQIKKPIPSAKFNLTKQFLLFLQSGFSPYKEMENVTCPVIKTRSFETPRPGSSLFQDHEKKALLLGVCSPLLAIMSALSAIWSYFRKIFKKKEKTPEITDLETPVSSPLSNALAGFPRYRYRELSAATKHFNLSELLGSGRYSFVYRAIFRGSVQMYAVKRFNQNAASKLSFEIEATTIHRLHHGKILELRGWCDENPNEPLLVYDYMHNRSLQEALWNRHRSLRWHVRYNIAVGVAEALVYLHEECQPRVIHSDIKEGNVMLDADYNPKLGDFGLAMNGPPYTIRRERTERDPPECQPFEEVTVKFDVYLYGSMLLGLCCRRNEQLKKFCRRLRNLKVEGRLLEAVDQSLNGRYNEEEMLRLLNVALQCLEQRVQRRPSMVEVLQILMEGAGGEIEEDEPIFFLEI